MCLLLLTPAHTVWLQSPLMPALQAFKSNSTRQSRDNIIKEKGSKNVKIFSSLWNFHLTLYCFAEDSLVNGFNQDEKGVLHTQPSCCPPPIPPLSCIPCIPLEQMFTCSYSAFNRLMVGVRQIDYENSLKNNSAYICGHKYNSQDAISSRFSFHLKISGQEKWENNTYFMESKGNISGSCPCNRLNTPIYVYTLTDWSLGESQTVCGTQLNYTGQNCYFFS